MATAHDSGIEGRQARDKSHVHPTAELPWPTSTADWDAIARCHHCGLTLLRLFIDSADWVVRRVENIEFIDERTVRRRMSVDYTNPPDTVVFARQESPPSRVIPLTIMRRKSLTNFDLRGQDGLALSLLGLRETQALTLSILRAWADRALAAEREPRLGGDVEEVLHAVVAGDQSQLRDAYEMLGEAKARDEAGPLGVLGRDDVFMALLERLAGNFILFTLDDGPRDSRRIVKFSCDEPLTLRYASATYRGHADGPSPGGDRWDERPELSYGLGEQKLAWLRKAPRRAALGFTPTLIRFPVPAAELTTSFHFEVTAPPDVSIVEASLLAGLPNLYMSQDEDPIEDKAGWRDASLVPGLPGHRRPSFDSVGGGYPTVDLHVVDVPVGSLARAQVALQASPKGWLGTAAVVTWLATLTLFVSARVPGTRDEAATTVLITFAAAMVGALVRPDPHRMVTRLLSGVRIVVGASAALTLTAAFAFATFTPDAPTVVLCLAFASSVPALIVSWSWWSCHQRLAREKLPPRAVATSRRNKRERVRLSPWEQHPPGETPDEMADQDFHVELVKSLEEADYPFDLAVIKLSFDAPAIKVASAEGARTRFSWNRAFHEEFRSRMQEHRREPAV